MTGVTTSSDTALPGNARLMLIKTPGRLEGPYYAGHTRNTVIVVGYGCQGVDTMQMQKNSFKDLTMHAIPNSNVTTFCNRLLNKTIAQRMIAKLETMVEVA